jgi:fructose-bisphosphate aldolase, class II
MATKFRSGVLHGQEVKDLFDYANQNNFALPAVNVVSSSTINAVMETAKAVNSPVIIQFSNGGGSFMAGQGLSNDGQKASILGSISGAMHVHTLAKAYGVSVILHTDHCAKKLLPWIDGSMRAKIFSDCAKCLCFLRTCSTFQKNLCTKTSKFVKNILPAWLKWV